MSTAALASGALAADVTTPATEVTQSPGETRRRRRIAGTTTEPLPARACSGEVLGREAQLRGASGTGASRGRSWSTDIEPSVLQLTRRGKVLLTVVSVLVFGAAVAVLGLRVAGVLDPTPRFDHTVQVEVGAGQTLWSIAQETNPAEDTALVVEQIADLNNLRTSSDVIPGQTLLIPVR
ncbi:LysM peptidoglycan-binding domain-containing protein [Kribbella sp. CA-293567]|uniref:LysM peptidoglycan-binding domain-containing protein n=1 Tax=Kribbella sp. CA-293567 TaxID=3002436 RepID=UPI0022DDCBE7|nr:LysM peptidoglycan-binding domain-containing protein [Kribbella sp. CA-293567]WBQ07759.1 LysM peptidoglycan-binding domain-containing protein [Kribbella sp. CA-293567]